MNDWRVVIIDEIKANCKAALSTGPFGSSIGARTFREEGVPVIRGSNLSQEVGTRLIDDGLVFVDEDVAKTFQRSTVREGDLIFTCWGTINQIGLIDSRSRFREYIISNKQMKLTPDRSLADSLFLYYAFSSPKLQSAILASGIGSSVPGFNLGQLRSMRIDLPPLSEQRAIASILGALDDKIELNRKLGATLEAMVRALFKSWFVDFEPVRAKVEGRDTGLPPEIAAPFPSSFDDFELGEIPKGWRVGALNEICTSIESGGTPARKRPEYWDHGTIPWFKTGELNDGPLLDSSEHITDLALQNSSAKLWPPGTILFALYASPTVGRMGLLATSGTSNQAAAGLAADPRYGIAFLYHTLLCARQELQHIAVGAAQQNINLGILKTHKIIVPSYELAQRFSALSEPFIDRQVTIAHESHTLSSLRDTLLPKLISGEIRVSDAERIVAKSA